MRLSNDRDQEIIKSAIPNSSISTTSFLSSIGNGEAIAFGEAIAVPMRMKFARVEKRYLPMANGVIDKGTEETPDTVDLRTIVARMRAVSGPDISAFQQSYGTANPAFVENSPEAEEMDDDFPPANDAEMERWSQELRTTGHVSLSSAATPPLAQTQPSYAQPAPARPIQPEPYRPDMLPRTSAPEPAAAPRPDRFADLRRERSTDNPPPTFQRPAPPADNAPRPNPLLRREGSLRESLLKKPLSSLYDKD